MDINDLKTILKQDQIDDLAKNLQPPFSSEKALIGQTKIFGRNYEIQIIVTRDEDDFMEDYE